jgi:hypothetical protein
VRVVEPFSRSGEEGVVPPAEAGVQVCEKIWIPVFTGMTCETQNRLHRLWQVFNPKLGCKLS